MLRLAMQAPACPQPAPRPAVRETNETQRRQISTALQKSCVEGVPHGRHSMVRGVGSHEIIPVSLGMGAWSPLVKSRCSVCRQLSHDVPQWPRTRRGGYPVRCSYDRLW